MIAMVATELARFVYNEVTRDAPAEEGADFSEQSHKLEKVFDALANSKANLFLIDIDALPFDAEDIVERLTALRDATKAPVIIFAKGYPPTYSIIEVLRLRGFELFVTASFLSGLKDELQDCLQGATNSIKQALKELELVKKEMTSRPRLPYHTVGFAGSMPRVGTTTMAIQFARYMLSKGYAVCYMEMGCQGHVQQILKIEKPEYHDYFKGYIRYRGLDMFYQPTNVPQAQLAEYDVCIMDFGAWKPAVLPSFINMDVRVCLGETKPWEILRLREIMTLLADEDIVYCCPSTSPEDKKSVFDALRQENPHVFFPAYTPSYNTVLPGNRAFNEYLHYSIYPEARLTLPRKIRNKLAQYVNGVRARFYFRWPMRFPSKKKGFATIDVPSTTAANPNEQEGVV